MSFRESFQDQYTNMRSYYSYAPNFEEIEGGGILLLFFVVIMPPILKVLRGGRHIAFVFYGNYAPNFEEIEGGDILLLFFMVIMPPILKKLRWGEAYFLFFMVIFLSLCFSYTSN